MRIIRRLPFYPHETSVESPTGQVRVVPYQIVVWVAVGVQGAFSRPFPAILDTGHSHNLSIDQRQLYDWTGVRAAELRTVGDVTINERSLPAKRAEVGLFPNRPGTREPLGEPYELVVPQGIIVFPEADPRLPLLGLRGLVRSGLRTVINGEKMHVSIGSGWFV